MKAKRFNGFTLIELLVTVAVLAILVAIAMPSMQGLLLNNKMSIAQDNLAQMLQQAKTLALSRSVISTVQVSKARGNAVLTLSDKSAIDGLGGAASASIPFGNGIVVTDETFTFNPSGVVSMAVSASGVTISATGGVSRCVLATPLGSIQISKC